MLDFVDKCLKIRIYDGIDGNMTKYESVKALDTASCVVTHNKLN